MDPTLTPPPTNHKTILIAGGVVALIVIVAVTLILTRGSKGSGGQATPTPTTAPTATVTPTPSPDNQAKGSSAPTFSGFDNLLDHGVTSDQVDALKFAFTKYGQTSGKTIKQVDLDTPSLVFAAPNQDLNYSVATFNVNLDGKTTYFAKLNYSRNLTAIELFLSTTPNSPVLYDSGNIDLFEGIGN